MHLNLVPKRTFAFEAAFGIAIPEETLRRAEEDAPTAETPFGLEDLRYRFSDLEEDGAGSFHIDLADLKRATRGLVVTLVNHHYASAKIAEVFARWQASNASRGRLVLNMETAGQAVMVSVKGKTHAH